MPSDLHSDASALEEGRAQQNGHGSHDNHHHNHNHHATKRMKQLAHARKHKREAARMQSKLPGVMKVGDTADMGKIRKRLIIKNEIIAGVAEFCGTFLFLFFAFGIATQAGQQQLSQSTSGESQSAGVLNPSQLLYSSLGFGFSLAVNAWVFFRVSGGLFNPAVTLGLFLCGALSWYRSVILFIVQFVAAIAAAGVSQAVIPGGISARTRLGNNTSLAQGFFIEMFCTSMLMFAIYMLAGEKHKATFIAPVGIGLALFLCELFATGLTGGSLNPARTLGPDVVAATFDSSTWIYYTAPFVGTLLSAAVYWALKASHYETANEGQDADDDRALILRDIQGNVTGAVQRVDVSDAPDIPGLRDHSTASIIAAAAAHAVETNNAGIPTGATTTRAPSIIVTAGADGADAASLYRATSGGAAGRESFQEKDRSAMLQPEAQHNEAPRTQDAVGVAQRDFTTGKTNGEKRD